MSRDIRGCPVDAAEEVWLCVLCELRVVSESVLRVSLRTARDATSTHSISKMSSAGPAMLVWRAECGVSESTGTVAMLC